VTGKLAASNLIISTVLPAAILPASAEGFRGGCGSGGDSFETCDENIGTGGGERDVQVTVTMAELEDKSSKNYQKGNYYAQ
jgi:hypothetical protein